MTLNGAGTFFFALIATHILFAQNGSTLVTVGKDSFPLWQVAPGQIVELRMAGMKLLSVESRSEKAMTVPLPTTLTGISVSITQFFRGVTTTLPAPMLAVNQLGFCNDTLESSSPDCYITLLSIQIPYELAQFGGPNGLPDTNIVITQNGKDSVAFPLLVAPDSIHVIGTCEAGTSWCGPAVTHSGGTLVSPDSPAKAGETVVIYAVGLGGTMPRVKTGEATPAPASTLGFFTVDFLFRPNSVPSHPYSTSFASAQKPVFVGLTQGQVGLYQINVKLPDIFPPVPACNTPFLNVQSNLTINIANFSFDGAPICVEGSL